MGNKYTVYINKYFYFNVCITCIIKQTFSNLKIVVTFTFKSDLVSVIFKNAFSNSLVLENAQQRELQDHMQMCCRTNLTEVGAVVC